MAATHARDVWAMWAAGERPFDELFSSYRKCVSQNKPKNAGRSREIVGMWEIHQNAGFPA